MEGECWRGGYVRIGSVSVRVREGRVGDSCCCLGGGGWSSTRGAKNRRETSGAGRLATSVTSCFKHPSALDRLPKLKLAGSADRLSRPTSQPPKKTRTSDKSDKLRILTEKLLSSSPHKQQPEAKPVLTQRAPSEPPVDPKREPDPIFDVKLTKPESRAIIGSYIQRTIPFRSASFSQVDFSSTDGKYIRNARNAALANKAGASLSLPRKKLSDGDQSISPASSSTLPASSNVSIDSAVGSEEWLLPKTLPRVEKPLENKGCGTRSLTHPLGRRGSHDEEIPYSSIDGNGLKSLTTDRVLEGVKEESDTDSAAATSETLSQSVSPAPQHKQWLESEFSDHPAVYHLSPSSPPNEVNDDYLKDIIEEEPLGEGISPDLVNKTDEKKDWTWPSSGTEDPQTPEEANRPQWPKLKPKLICQSSEEREDDGKTLVKRCHHLLARADSLSEGESDCGCRSQTPNRGSPSLFAPSDQSDTEGKHLNRSPHPPRRYSKRPVRGPYGEMLAAEMKKPEVKKFTKHNDDLKFLEEFSKPNEIRPRGRTMDDSQLRGCYSGEGPKRKVSANLPYKNPSEQPIVHHQRTTSSPSQLEGCSSNKQPEPSHQLLAHLLKGSSERSLDKPSPIHLLMNSPAHWKVGNDLRWPGLHDFDTRTHIVVEIYETERSYVESLQILVMKYLQPLKSSENSSLVDSGVVDEIFYQIPEILAHHKVFLDELHKRLECWDINQSVGDLFLDTFTKQSVIDTYTAFINNWKHAKEAIKSTCQSKPAFARFLETMAREHKGKLALDSLLIMPVQRIPRFELLIQRLIKNTDNSHADASLLVEAQQAVHELAETINLGQQKALNPRGSNCQELVQLESIIEGLAGLSAPERTFLCHDQVSITTSQGRKDRALFLFNDLLIITSIKRRSGTIRKPSQNVPGSVVSSLEGNKYKLLMKIPLDDLEIVKAKDDSVRRMLKEMEQLTTDVSTLSQMAELVTTLHCPHSQLEESIREMLLAINKQLVERHAADSQLSYLELMINTQNGMENIALLFSKPEKRTSWEENFNEAKQRLAMSGDRRVCPELVSAVPIRKTRAGLQFTCAAPTFGHGPKDVWVCNSDGYVGQVCVLSLHPEPTVTSCNGVCNARILCIAPVPGQSTNGTHSNYDCNSGISISVEDTDKSTTNIQLDSSSSSSEEEEREEEGDSTNSEENMTGTMWLGTEDGCIHVYNCTDNIRTKKNKVKIQHTSPVHTIIYLENKVFVSLANGDITRYIRESSGMWNTNDVVTVSVGSVTMPVTKMVPIGGRLWCSCHTSVKVLNTSSLQVEHSFVASGETGRAITAIAVSGYSVWISLHNSAIIRLFHASTYEWLGEVNVAPAVTKMLASSDDIIRQHKAACLRVTSLLACKDLLWIGTSAGVILTMHLPHVSQTTNKITSSLNAVGVPHGHTGHVRFLTTVDMTHPGERGKPERRKLLVISGGDGYEDFRAAGVSEVAGREDSTNHLLLWNV